MTKKCFASVNSNLSSLEYPTCIYFAIQIVAQCGAICNNMCRIKGSTGEQKCIAIRFEHRCPYQSRTIWRPGLWASCWFQTLPVFRLQSNQMFSWRNIAILSHDIAILIGRLFWAIYNRREQIALLKFIKGFVNKASVGL